MMLGNQTATDDSIGIREIVIVQRSTGAPAARKALQELRDELKACGLVKDGSKFNSTDLTPLAIALPGHWLGSLIASNRPKRYTG